MSKFCTSCGASLADDAGFCTSCGAAQNTAQSQSEQTVQQEGFTQGYSADASAGGQQSSQSPANDFAKTVNDFAGKAADSVKQTFDGVSVNSVVGAMTVDNIKNIGKTKNKNLFIGLGAIALVLIIVVIILVSSITPGYEKPVAKMVKSMQKADGATLIEAFPDYFVEYMEDYIDDYSDWIDYDSVEEMFDEELYDTLDELEDDYGENIKISYKVLKKKEIKKSALSDLEDDIEDTYDEKVDVTKGYELKVELSIKGKDDDDTETEWINVYKIDGKWCIDPNDSLF